MPGNPRAIVADAERRFPLRIAVKVSPGGIGQRYTAMSAWLDDNCGIDGWAMAPAGTRGVLNDAMAIYMSTPTCAVAFVARWLVPGDPPGFYQVRDDEPETPCAGVTPQDAKLSRAADGAGGPRSIIGPADRRRTERYRRPGRA